MSNAQTESGSTTIAFIGCGKMGSAILEGFLATAPKQTHIFILEPGALNEKLASHPQITHITSAQELCAASNEKTIGLLLLAVKPQIMDDVCESLRPAVSDTTLILSIAAGQTLCSFEKRFGQSQPIIRTMPNLPASIGQGMSVAVTNTAVSPEQKALAESLLSSSGKLEWVEDESLMDAVTALSGSGPAYIFLLIETLAKAGQKQGLDTDLAMTLARQTVIGSAALVKENPAATAATLRQNVTSPGGTTQAALEILMNGEFQKLFDEALSAATQRSRELSA